MHSAQKIGSPDELVMFTLDDEDIDTDLAATPWHDSFVGELPREKESIAESTARAQASLVASVRDLEKICEAFDTNDVSALAAETSLRRRIGSLALLVSAFGNASAFAQSREHRELFASDGLLTPYLAGARLWTTDVIDTLAVIAQELNAVAPNWSSFRERLEDVAWIHETVIVEQSRVEKVSDALPDDLRAALAELFEAFASFKPKLDAPFG